MVQLCNRGLTYLAVIDLLRRCYGNNLSGTKMCDILCRAKAEDYHLNLGLHNQQQNNRGAQQRSRRQDVCSSAFHYCFTAVLYSMSENYEVLVASK
jgi:hypothetical protein